MKPFFRTQPLALALFLCLPRGAGALERTEGSFERTLKVTGPVDLDVRTGSGSIRVHAGESGAMRVEGRIRASSGWLFDAGSAEERIARIEANPPIEQTGNSIRIGWTGDEDLWRNISISYEIWAPAETRLRGRAGSGSVFAERLKGPVVAMTGSGTITVSRIEASVEASAGSGSISVDSVAGGLKARAGSGSIRADNVRGGLSASTGSGSVEISEVSGAIDVETGSGSVRAQSLRGSLEARTGSGSITAEGEQTGEWQLRSSSGGITVRLPADASFDIHCRASSGGIHTDFPVTIQGTLRRKEIEGRVRGGGPLLQATSSSGSIRVLSRSGT